MGAVRQQGQGGRRSGLRLHASAAPHPLLPPCARGARRAPGERVALRRADGAALQGHDGVDATGIAFRHTPLPHGCGRRHLRLVLRGVGLRLGAAAEPEPHAAEGVRVDVALRLDPLGHLVGSHHPHHSGLRRHGAEIDHGQAGGRGDVYLRRHDHGLHGSAVLDALPAALDAGEGQVAVSEALRGRAPRHGEGATRGGRAHDQL
mmetsp:Transcript_59150/g.152109  ORF Transcript_59150/g.152109 Transcript_59150/m.152109 type:complete len:205 (-) Transcript_59150:239-853(-)